MNLIENLKKSSWQFKAAWSLVVLFLIIELYYFSQLTYLPGPIYGGDIYAHHGFSINYRDNGFWTDPYFKGEYAFYPWLGNYLFLLISLLTFVSLKTAMNFTPVITTFFGAVAFYFLGRQIFKTENKALLTMVLWVFYRGIPEAAPNNLLWLITIPLWFYFWLKIENKGTLKDKILTGVFIGLSSLSQVAFFLAGMAVFIFTILTENFVINYKMGFVNNLVDFFKKYSLALFVGILISLLFYGPIIFIYHAKTLNPLFQYNGPDIDTLGVGYVAKELWRGFFNFSDLRGALFGLLSFLGFIFCVSSYKKKEMRFVLLWFIAGFLAPLHHLITRPLFNKWTLPTHLWGNGISMFFFFIIGVFFVLSLTKYLNIWDKKAKILLIGLLVFFLLNQSIFNYNDNPWVTSGRMTNPSMDAWWKLGDWIQKNTDINDVFIAFDETCFAINGVSGRKCLMTRRTHSNYFVDVEIREADLVVALFGNSTEKTKEILKKYDIKYFLADPMLVQSYQKVLPKYEEYLIQNGVKFQKVVDRLDPSLNEARKFDILAVPFQTLTLTSLVEPIVEFKVEDKSYLQMFKIKD